MSRRSLALLLVVLVALAGCSAGGLGGAGEPAGGDGGDAGDGGGGGSGGGDAGAASGAPQATRAPAAEATPAADGSGGSAAAQARARALIRTGEVRLRVDDFDRARDRLVSIAESRGGFVADSAETTHREDNRTWTEGRLVLRVPSESFTPAFREVKAAGTVERADSSTADVTDRLVDLEARLKNLEARRDRLRTLYDEANGTEDVLRVGRELSEVQGQIERLEAKRRALEDRVALATITVRFSEPRPEPTPTPTPTPEPAYHETGLGAAFLASVNGAVVAVRTIAVTIAYAAPYLLVFGLPVGLVGVGLYRVRGGRLFDR
jgi:hypothetical protein